MTGSYLDMQAYIGITKHAGGYRATNALLALCHVEDAREVLDVGCGIGVGPVHVARTYGCRVVGIDISERMVEWSRRRAREARLEGLIQLRIGDVLDLPFESDRFDVTMCESVLAFVADKERAIAEMVRVTKPGGYVGLNEAFLPDASPSPPVAELMDGLGTEMVTLERWRALWDASGLRDRVVRTYRVDPGREVRDRIRWIGLPSLVRSLARVVRLYVTEPSLRRAVGVVLGAGAPQPAREPGAPPPWASHRYGLFVGRKP